MLFHNINHENYEEGIPYCLLKSPIYHVRITSLINDEKFMKCGVSMATKTPTNCIVSTLCYILSHGIFHTTHWISVGNLQKICLQVCFSKGVIPCYIIFVLKKSLEVYFCVILFAFCVCNTYIYRPYFAYKVCG